ncbi:MAG: 3-oxoacyl-ACP reductase FabG [Eubacteriales bacterium]
MEHIMITGGSRGIGAAMVQAFARAGYRVSFTYHTSLSAAEQVAAISGAFAVPADVRDERAVRAAFARAEAQNGPFDGLVNNAGIAGYGLFTDCTYEAWQNMMAVHVGGAFLCTRAVLGGMISRKKGKIINISSVWGMVGASCEVAYATSKAALIGMTKSLAKELGPSGITVNCIAPGVIDTDMLADCDSRTIGALVDSTPLGRLGTGQDVAATALFLAGPGGDFVTGQVLSPNGGFVI